MRTPHPRLLVIALVTCLLSSAMYTYGQEQPPLASGIERQNFDPTVRIQDDLFLAVNGNWIKNTPIPADRSSYGAFHMLRDLSESRVRGIIESLAAAPQKAGSEEEKIALLYASFMDEAEIERKGIAAVLPALRAIDALHTPNQIARYWGSLPALGVDAPLSIEVGQDQKDSTRYVLEISQGGLGLPDRDYYLESDARFEQARKAYLGYLSTLFSLAQEDQPQQKAQAVLDLETAMAQAQWSRVDNRNPEKTYHKMSRADLLALTDQLDWDALLEAAQVAKVDSLNLHQPNYAQALAGLLHSQPLAHWQAYLKARQLDAAAPLLPKAWVQAHFEFHDQALNGNPQIRPRWKRAVQMVQEAMGEAVGKRYVAQYFSAQAKAKMDTLVGNLRAAYSHSIDNLSWMSDTTKAQAQKKLAAYMTKIGYPSTWRDYSALTVLANDALGNAQRGAAFEYQRGLAKLGHAVDRGEWFLTPQTVNAYYNARLNEIVFPAAILEPPFFNPLADDAVNYGAIGAVIGHEISHGFDDHGSQFDSEGNLKSWWTEEDRAAFHTLTEQLVAQYAAYEPLPGKHINGELTLGENIADLSGLQIAFKAYRLSLAGKEAPVIDGLTGNQRFFIGFSQVWRNQTRDARMLNNLVSDPHSPSNYRPIGAAVNSDAFVETFDVKPGDKMYKPSAQRIRIW